MQCESIPLRAIRNSKRVRGECKPTLCSLIPPGFWPWRAWLWVVPSPNRLHQHLQPFTPWSAEDLVAGCCPMLCHCYVGPHSHSIPLVFPRWPGNEYTRKEMRTKKQWQGEKPEQCVPAPTTASSDQPNQSAAGEGQCKGSGFLPPNQQTKVCSSTDALQMC